MIDSKLSAMKEISARIDMIYSRQQEVVIGKRNINCLSCNGGLVEPELTSITGKDGRVYKGKSPNRTRPTSLDREEKQFGTLLSLKWDHLRTSPVRGEKQEGANETAKTQNEIVIKLAGVGDSIAKRGSSQIMNNSNSVRNSAENQMIFFKQLQPIELKEYQNLMHTVDDESSVLKAKQSSHPVFSPFAPSHDKTQTFENTPKREQMLDLT